MIAAFGVLNTDSSSQAEHVTFVSADFQYRSALLCLFNRINKYIPQEQRPSFNKIMNYKPVSESHYYLIISEDRAKKVDDYMKAGCDFLVS